LSRASIFFRVFWVEYQKQMRKYFPPGAFCLVTTLIVIAVVAAVTSAILGIVAAANPPKPGKINFGYGEDQGPRYGTFGPLDNIISNEVAVTVLYGQVKLAGNVLWQTDPGETVKRVVALGEGEISDITDVRANDIVIDDTNTPGSSYNIYKGTQTQKADSRVPAELRPNLEFHNTAYIALTLVASEKLKGGYPTITSVCKGLLVSVWRNGAWTTAKEYSRNPAACVRDFILNARYGLGISSTTLDDATFGEVFDHCEELVDGPSGKEARFCLDYAIDAQKPAQDVLNDILATFMGFMVYAGNKVKLRVEKEELITQYFGDGSTTKANATFDPSNIVKDSFNWNMSSLDDRPNRIRVQWVDPDQNYVKVYTQVEDRIDQDNRNTIIPKDISLLGITRQSQASRMAKMYMSIAKYANIQIQWSARLESIQCEVGDVVAVTHQSARFTRRLFRITDMQEAEDETIRFTGREYNASLYDDAQATAIVVYDQPTGPNLYAALSDVTNLTVLEDNFKQKDGVFATNILVSWTALPADQLLRLDRHLIQISQDGGATYRDAAFASSLKTSYRIPLGNVQTGTTFTVRVKTISDRGAESPGATADVTIEGKVTPPTDVQDFSVTFGYDHLAMTWSAVNDEDLFAYEIRVGNATSVWETASIVATELLTTKFDLFNFTRGSKKFFIKAIDNSGNYSENAASDSILITDIPESNVVASADLWNRMTVFPHPLQGTLSSELDRIPTNDYDARYNRIALQPRTELTWGERKAAGGTWAQLQASSFVFGEESYVTTEQSWITQPIDLGAVFVADVIIDMYAFSSSNLGFVSIQIATSTDGITYSAFKTYTSGQYNARYIKFKFLIQATDPETRVRLAGVSVIIDVPDRYQRFTNQPVTALGTTFNLTGFTSVKSIVIQTVLANLNLTPDYDNTNLPNSFVVKLFNSGSVAQPGNVDIYVSGY
jgi:hypothetical protein